MIQDNITFNSVKELGTGIASRPIGIVGINGVNEFGGIINAVDIDWNGAEINNYVVINTTGELLNWIKSISIANNELKDENANLLQKIKKLEKALSYIITPEEPEEKNYNVIINDSNDSLTLEDIIASINTEVEKPELVQALNMSNLSSPTDSYLVYPLSWEIIKNDQIISPIIKDWNGFEIGFNINEDTPTVMINEIEYRVSDIKLGKGSYTIEFE